MKMSSENREIFNFAVFLHLNPAISLFNDFTLAKVRDSRLLSHLLKFNNDIEPFSLNIFSENDFILIK